MAVLVDPRGDFPLNDDWAFAVPVVSLVNHGAMEFSGAGAPNLFSQALWGSAFVWAFGFSFTVLRFSTLLLAPLAFLSAYEIAKESGLGERSALVAALALLGNPLFLVLSSTFMSDVPFCAFALAAVALLLKGTRRGSPALTGLGLLLATAALLNRQLGLAVFIGFAAAVVAKGGVTKRSLLSALAIVALGLGAQAGFSGWLHLTGRTPSSYGSQIHSLTLALREGPRWVALAVLKQGIVFTIYLGLFAMPFLIPHAGELARALRSRLSRRGLALLAGLGVAVLACLGPAGLRLPILGNVLSPAGLGPLTLRDTYLLGASADYALPAWFWRLLTGAGAVGGVVLGLCAVSGCRRIVPLRDQWPAVFLGVMGAAYVLPLTLIHNYDRYLLFLVPLLPALIGSYLGRGAEGRQQVPGPSFGLTCLAAVLTCGFSVAATHDYLAWNRARWAALRGLLQEGVQPRSIDGGYEFNGWFLFDPGYKPVPGKSWWWVDQDDYIVSFSPLHGYRELRSVRFSPWLPTKMDRVRVLRKEKSG